jgi:uncharacterized protein (DUF2236 family)
MYEPRFIDLDDLQAWLTEAKRQGVDPAAGVFGPDSMMWRIGKESLGFLGSGRAALLQLAHPWVANAIDQHSDTRTDPIGRFNRTFINVFTMIFGSMEQVERSARRVHAVHKHIHGELAEDSGAFAGGSYYQANEAHAMLWVHATLWDTQIRMYELVLGELSAEEKEAYYQETKRFAWLFGIPDELIPEDWNAFQDYMERMYASDVLTVGQVGHEMGSMIFSFDMPFARMPLNWLRTITAEVMPERLARGFGLPAESEQRRRTFERSVRWIRRLYPRLPARLRYIPPYTEARRRMDGKGHADWTTRKLNRLYLGQEELVS